MKQIGYIILLALVSLSTQAKSPKTIEPRIENQSLTVTTDGSLVINMDVVIDKDVKIASDRMITITPVLQSKGSVNNDVLPSIYVYGRRRDVITQRERKTPQNAYKVLRRKKDETQTINYLASIPYQTWMQASELEVRVDTYGCANALEGRNKQSVAQLMLERYTMKPVVAFVTPKVEAIKTRSEEGKAYLDFPVNQMTINPTYRRNTDELNKIIKTINLVKNDKNTSFTNLKITGFASPEGSYSANARLAQGRAEALKRYLLSLYDINANQIQVNSVPEDWENLRIYVENSAIVARDQILSIIDDTNIDYDAKERQIKALYDGKPYTELLRDCYPSLRHSDYVVQFVVRGFTAEEAKEIINTNPQMLSLEEMFRVAQTYDQGSDKFNEVFDVAVRMFPKDLIANINAAAIELKRGDLKSAQKYLDRSDAQSEVTLNNKGVLSIMEGDLDKAEQILKQAKELGSAEAAINLEEIAKKRENIALVGNN